MNVEEVKWFAERATKIEMSDPVLRELKEHLRAATAWVGRADADLEMTEALRAENQAIQDCLEYVASKHRKNPQ